MRRKASPPTKRGGRTSTSGRLPLRRGVRILERSLNASVFRMSHFLVSKKTRPFLTIWLGQFLSIIGSGMTSFVMAIWSYQRHWSTGQFSTVVLAAALPGIIMAPFAGALVDRWDKRLTMMGAVAGQAI